MKRLTLIVICFVLIMFAISSILFEIADTSQSPWPTYQQNSQRQGLSPYSTNAINGSVGWTLEFNGTMRSSPVIGSDGTIYVGVSDEMRLIAISPDGTIIWSFETEDDITSTPSIDTSGNIYFGSDDFNLYAVDKDGKLIWKRSYQRWIKSNPLIIGDTIIVNTGDLTALDRDGKDKWVFPCFSQTYSSASCGLDGTVYFGSLDGNLYALNPENGKVKWSYQSFGPLDGTPTVDPNGIIYFSSQGGLLYSIYPNGTLNWIYQVNTTIFSSASIGPSGTIYFGDGENRLHALFPNGTLKWSFQTDWRCHNENGIDYENRIVGISSPVISKDGTIYVGSTGGTFFALDVDGKQLWNYSFNSDILVPPAINKHGSVFVVGGEEAGHLVSFESENVQPEEDPIQIPINYLLLIIVITIVSLIGLVLLFQKKYRPLS